MDSAMLFPSAGLGIVVYLAVAFVLLHVLYRSFRPSLKLPPGPPGWPIIGHLHLLDSHPHSLLAKAQRLESFEYIRVEEVSSMLASVFQTCGRGLPVNLREELSTGYVKRMKECNRRFDIFLEEVLEEHNAKRKGVENFVAKDMVNVLLQLDMIAGGTESSATLVEWDVSELLRKPEGFKKAAEEMKRVVGRERWIEEKDIPELPFLQAIVKETMRLHPVTPMLIPHLSTKECRIGGYDIPPNITVVLAIEGSTIDVKGHDFELLPFGSGRRMCPGYNLGLKVVQLGLANLIHGFNWRLFLQTRVSKDLDMWETYGLSTPKAHPLVAVAEPRLRFQLYASLITNNPPTPYDHVSLDHYGLVLHDSSKDEDMLSEALRRRTRGIYLHQYDLKIDLEISESISILVSVHCLT
eukprot:Gb_34497 [translate_table: standard]